MCQRVSSFVFRSLRPIRSVSREKFTRPPFKPPALGRTSQPNVLFPLWMEIDLNSHRVPGGRLSNRKEDKAICWWWGIFQDFLLLIGCLLQWTFREGSSRRQLQSRRHLAGGTWIIYMSPFLFLFVPLVHIQSSKLNLSKDLKGFRPRGMALSLTWISCSVGQIFKNSNILSNWTFSFE